jgi:hypothetical protein
MNVHWRKLTNEREGKSEQKFYAAFGTIFRLVRISKEASRNFKFIFLFADDLKHDLASTYTSNL